MELGVLEKLFRDFEIEQGLPLFKPLREIALKDDPNTKCESPYIAVDFDDFTERLVVVTDKLTRSSVDSLCFKHDKNALHFIEFKGFSNLQTGFSYRRQVDTEINFTQFVKEKFISFNLRAKIENSIEKTLIPFIQNCYLEEESKSIIHQTLSETGEEFDSHYYVHFDCPLEDFEMFRLLTLDEVFNFKLPYLKSEPKLIFEYH